MHSLSGEVSELVACSRGNPCSCCAHGQTTAAHFGVANLPGGVVLELLQCFQPLASVRRLGGSGQMLSDSGAGGVVSSFLKESHWNHKLLSISCIGKRGCRSDMVARSSTVVLRDFIFDEPLSIPWSLFALPSLGYIRRRGAWPRSAALWCSVSCGVLFFLMCFSSAGLLVISVLLLRLLKTLPWLPLCCGELRALGVVSAIFAQ